MTADMRSAVYAEGADGAVAPGADGTLAYAPVPALGPDPDAATASTEDGPELHADPDVAAGEATQVPVGGAPEGSTEVAADPPAGPDPVGGTAEVPRAEVPSAEVPSAEIPRAEVPPAAGAPAGDAPADAAPEPVESLDGSPDGSPDGAVDHAAELVTEMLDGAAAGPAPAVVPDEVAAAGVADTLRPVLGGETQVDPADFAAAAVLDVLRAAGWADSAEASELRAEAERTRELLTMVVRDHRAREASAAGSENQQLYWLVPLLRAAHGVAFGSLGAKVALRTAIQEVPPEVLAQAGLRIDYGVEPSTPDEDYR
jgi:hypothetical protein